jgi:hypothetical protein
MLPIYWFEYLENRVDKKFLSVISGKRERQSPPSFWLLETLIGLKDWA